MNTWGPPQPALSAADIYAVHVAAGFDPSAAVIMTAIALAESNGVPNAWNPVPPDDSIGLDQINMLAHGTHFGTKDQLVDPLTNARAAFALYAGRGGAFTDWSTYLNGAYQAFLAQAQAGATAAGGSPPVQLADVAPLLAGVNTGFLLAVVAVAAAVLILNR
jgi:Lysozyme like domain